MKTNKDYKVHFKVANTDYGILIVPKGTELTHVTATGIDKDYHFVNSTDWIDTYEDGSKQHGLIHDVTYYGINVPKEFVSY